MLETDIQALQKPKYYSHLQKYQSISWKSEEPFVHLKVSGRTLCMSFLDWCSLQQEMPMEKPCKHQRVSSQVEFEDSAALSKRSNQKVQLLSSWLL